MNQKVTVMSIWGVVTMLNAKVGTHGKFVRNEQRKTEVNNQQEKEKL